MRRLLTTTMALGLVISAMSFTGIFADFTDRATTGDSSAESGEQPRIADLQISTTTTLDCADATWVDDLATGVIAATDLQPGDNSGQSVVCLMNAGTSDLDITLSAIDVVDTETDCTGDEEAAGDTTCGTGEFQGELAPALIASASRLDCDTSASQLAISPAFQSLANAPVAFGTLAAGEKTCVWLAVQMATPGQIGTTVETIQQAQTDKVEWRYAFDGTPS